MSGTVQTDLGQLAIVTDVLEAAGWTWQANTDVEPEPCWDSVARNVEEMRSFEPDWIIGLGGGSAMWVFYENPQFKTLKDATLPAEMALPDTMREVMPDIGTFEADRCMLVDHVLADVCTPANPVQVTREGAEALLTMVYGAEVGKRPLS